VDYYSAEYTDARGVDQFIIENDGKTLRASLRGLSLAGQDFDDLAPAEGTPSELLHAVKLDHGCLCSCRIACVFRGGGVVDSGCGH
jgi:hypothetical protein